MSARLNATEILERLIGFDTTSHRSNLELIDWIANHLDGFQIASHRVLNDDGTKASLFASIGPPLPGGVVLSGHTDVVPVDGQPWSSDPFQLRHADDRLYGRGTADMKGFLAVALAALPTFLESPLKRPIHLAFSYDEEVGCVAAPALIDAMLDVIPRPGQAIIGEPTLMRMLNAHKGIFSFETSVTGLEGHSSAPARGVNAIVYASEIMHYLVEVARDLACGRLTPAFDPPHTTINIGAIRGGTAVNIIPRDCSFLWEFRPVPEDDPETLQARIDDHIDRHILPRMRAVHPASNVRTEIRAAVPGLAPEPACPAEELVRLLLEHSPEEAPSTAAFATEAGLFQRSGIPSVVCGPGSIEQAHKPDEFIAVEQLNAGLDFMHRLAHLLSLDNATA